jgi:hypothetical protein
MKGFLMSCSGVVVMYRCVSCTGVFLWGFSLPCIDIARVLLACGHVIAFYSCIQEKYRVLYVAVVKFSL